MKNQRGLLLLVFRLAGFCLDGLPFARASCVPLKGIESNVTGSVTSNTTLVLEDIMQSLLLEAFDPLNPPVPTLAECSRGLETSVSMRNLLEIDTAVFSVSSMFHPNNKALDIFGDKDASDSRRRCQPDEDDGEGKTLFDLHLGVSIIYAVVYGGYLSMPYCADVLERMMEERGHPLSLLLFHGDSGVDTPWGLAKAYVDETATYLLANDGWNADGSMSRSVNRIPYSDFSTSDSAGNTWTAYRPQNTPYDLTNERRWQPLMSTNDLGYITTQEHVTPYIGVTARFYGFNSTADEEAYASRWLEPPSYTYSYLEVAEEVLAETNTTATDDFKQAAVAFFDNKFNSLVPLKASYFVQGPTASCVLIPAHCVPYCVNRHSDKWSSFDFYAVTVSVQLAIYNSVVLVWREKIRHDLPRPTTIIRNKLGDKLVETYAGPGAGVQTIKASEWEPFVKTMAHSEFPSASACICQVFAEQVEHYLGDDEIAPPLQFGPFNFSSWSEISQVCSDSRVWGGMHFADSVPAGIDLCGGGDMAVSIAGSIARLVDGDEDAAVLKKNVGERMLRPL